MGISFPPSADDGSCFAFSHKTRESQSAALLLLAWPLALRLGWTTSGGFFEELFRTHEAKSACSSITWVDIVREAEVLVAVALAYDWHATSSTCGQPLLFRIAVGRWAAGFLLLFQQRQVLKGGSSSSSQLCSPSHGIQFSAGREGSVLGGAHAQLPLQLWSPPCLC